MIWHKPNINDLPAGEVLAISGDEKLLVGYLSYSSQTGGFMCEYDNVVLVGIVGYVEVGEIIRDFPFGV